MGVKVTVGEYQPHNRILQCWSCRNFGHSSTICHPGAQACGVKHRISDCNQLDAEVSKCANHGLERLRGSQEGPVGPNDTATTVHRQRTAPSRKHLMIINLESPTSLSSQLPDRSSSPQWSQLCVVTCIYNGLVVPVCNFLCTIYKSYFSILFQSY